MIFFLYIDEKRKTLKIYTVFSNFEYVFMFNTDFNSVIKVFMLILTPEFFIYFLLHCIYLTPDIVIDYPTTKALRDKVKNSLKLIIRLRE